MLPYWMLVLPPLFSYHIRFKGQTQHERAKATIKFFFILLFALLALRAPEIGRDLSNYRYYFNLYGGIGWDELGNYSTELGYVALNKVVTIFTDNFQWFLAACALLTICPIARVYKDEIEDPVWTIALFICMSTFIMLFSGLRQSIAMALGMLAFQCAKGHKFLPFLIVVAAATLFHRSAFILLIIYPLYHAKITKKWLYVVIPCLVAVFVYNKQIFTFLTLFIEDYYQSTISETGAYGTLILLILLSVYSFAVADETRLDDTTRGMRNILLLSVALQMFAPLHTLAMRMNYYFLLFTPLLIPKIAAQSRPRYAQVVRLSRYVMIVFFFAYFFVSCPKTNALDTFPYKFFWE